MASMVATLIKPKRPSFKLGKVKMPLTGGVPPQVKFFFFVAKSRVKLSGITSGKISSSTASIYKIRKVALTPLAASSAALSMALF
ncbi:MAG: hypothetical protein ACD_73C00421G0004 [uncultured bacterium]|nr:MAG: hypothetical protein ACD_73C00421G0004 [uncultured bacterium]